MINQEDDMEKKKLELMIVKDSLDTLLMETLGDIKQYEEGTPTEDIPFDKEDSEAIRDIITDIRKSEHYTDIAIFLFEGLMGGENRSTRNRKGEKILHEIIMNHSSIQKQIFVYDIEKPTEIPTRKQLVHDLKLCKSIKVITSKGNYPNSYQVLSAIVAKYDIKDAEWLENGSKSTLGKFTPKISKEQIEEEYEAGLLPFQIAKKYNLGHTFLAHCIYYDIEYRVRRKAEVTKESITFEKVLMTLKEAISKCLRKGTAIHYVANRLNVTDTTVYNYFRKNNIKLEVNNGKLCITTI